MNKMFMSAHFPKLLMMDGSMAQLILGVSSAVDPRPEAGFQEHPEQIQYSREIERMSSQILSR
jgi:hypothetical protein